MKLELIPIGNSRGIRIPKPLIDQCRLGDVVELRIIEEGLVIAPYRAARRGWKQAFTASQPKESEMLLDQMSPNAFDTAEWKW